MQYLPDSMQPRDARIRFIPLTKGRLAIVDAEDYPRLSKYKWYACAKPNGFYARCQRKRRYVYMHREICCAPRGVVVDHIDGNGLNNRKSNLRLCTVRQNLWNRRPAGGTSLYKGVCWRAEKKKWAARITCRDRRHHLGYFDTEMEAADAYDKKAAALFGEFAYLNFPNQSQPPNKFGG